MYRVTGDSPGVNLAEVTIGNTKIITGSINFDGGVLGLSYLPFKNLPVALFIPWVGCDIVKHQHRTINSIDIICSTPIKCDVLIIGEAL